MAPLVARTRYQYVVEAVRPVSEYVFAGAEAVAIWVKVTPSVERSTLTPVWFELVFVQARFIWLLLAAVAESAAGAASVWVAALTTLPYAESATPFVARTRYQYVVAGASPLSE